MCALNQLPYIQLCKLIRI